MYQELLKSHFGELQGTSSEYEIEDCKNSFGWDKNGGVTILSSFNSELASFYNCCYNKWNDRNWICKIIFLIGKLV